jgi:hypothetical protein
MGLVKYLVSFKAQRTQGIKTFLGVSSYISSYDIETGKKMKMKPRQDRMLGIPQVWR